MGRNRNAAAAGECIVRRVEKQEQQHLPIKPNAMRFLLLLPFAGMLLSFSGQKNVSQSETDFRKSPLSYTVGESKRDPKLLKTQAVAEFAFEFSYIEETPTDTGHEGSYVIVMAYNGTQVRTALDSSRKFSLALAPGKYVFQFYCNQSYEEIKTDSIVIPAGCRTPVGVYFQSATYPVISDKPVIYLYPEKTQPVNVQLTNNGPLYFTYPAYNNGWNFTADPDGSLHANGKTYSYLFWDGQTNIPKSSADWSKGFIVEKDSLVSFFENKLSAMGLSAREIDDYITYWVPRMSVNEKNYIHFSCNEEYAQFASLKITPQPDQLFRVYMIWSKAEENVSVQPQTLPSFQRNGFTVVEWGGTEMPQQPVALF